MLEFMNHVLEVTNDFLSGKVLIVLIVGLGGYFTVRSRFVQFRHFLHMFAVFRDSLRSSSGQLSSFQALMLSLAGRVGAGNIAGVGLAVTLGGPGAVFWMWVTALVGMSSSFIECSLAQLYKRKDSEGQYRGGPSYYIQHGLGKRWLGKIMAVLLLVTFGFAFNGLQSHAVTDSLNGAFGIDHTVTGICLAILLGLGFIGGIKRIAAISDLLVPVKTLIYIAVTIYVIALQIEHVPGMLMTIVKSAFGLDPVFGGLIGSAIVMGVKRGVFANEAGLGSAPNVAAVAQVEHPVSQGVVQAFSVFLDTFVICTCTALLILLSGIYDVGYSGNGIVLAQNSLAAVVGDWGRIFISVALALFVFTSILYNYYLGENSLRFLVGEKIKAIVAYRILVLVLILWGSMVNLNTVFAFADITMTLLAFVNLIALALLFKVAMRILRDYDDQRKAGIKTPVFDSSKFPDLDLDRNAWPANPSQTPQVKTGETADPVPSAR
ncbi:alanine/glycine:cation symporter family protein [Pseudomonas sp. 3A(2025)]